jgi:hypothetical protein
MRKILFCAAMIAALSGATAANAASERTLSGAAIGAGTGALVAGPIGAVAGGVVGAVVGGPRISGHGRTCWRDRRGVRHCRWR